LGANNEHWVLPSKQQWCCAY